MWGARQGFDKPTRPPEGISCRELEHKLQNVLMFSTVSNRMKRLKSPYITSSESFLSQIKPPDSADEAMFLAFSRSWSLASRVSLLVIP